MEVAEQINRAMADQGITRAELARRLGVTKGAVTQMLAPGGNYTVRTLQRLAEALSISLQVTIDTDGGIDVWYRLHPTVR